MNEEEPAGRALVSTFRRRSRALRSGSGTLPSAHEYEPIRPCPADLRNAVDKPGHLNPGR